MTTSRRWWIVSGFLVLASLLVAKWSSPYWSVVTVFVGLDLLQSGFTDWGFVAWLLDRGSGVEPLSQKRWGFYGPK